MGGLGGINVGDRDFVVNLKKTYQDIGFVNRVFLNRTQN